MDVFNLTKKQVIGLDFDEFAHMVNYAWTKFNVQRADLPWRGDDKGEEGIDYVSIDQSRYFSKVHT
ncbi:hypothetical protein LCGC14_0720490 [marine sediment metagenome]|uniref:Uncharacterized protein n=1 Tax=marine sediment metagenome TaxID=412755 RepID=A0A0F9SXY1_9ZZZZ